jgi:hypothetical protein
MKSVGSFKRVYVTGDKSASALVCVYDIFGLVDDVPFPACKMLTLPAGQVFPTDSARGGLTRFCIADNSIYARFL